MIKKIEETIEKHKIIALVIASIFFAFLTVLFASQVASFLFPTYSYADYYTDSTIFTILGKSMVEGKTPYLEVYDHKGLYIFYYTALAGIIGKPGLFIVQLLVFSVSNAFLMLAVYELSGRKATSVWAILIFMAFYCGFGQSPADADMEMPLMAVMFYFYARGFKRDSWKDFAIGNVFAGLSAGIAINLRLTDAMVALAFVIGFAVRCIMRRNWIALLRDAGLCIGGILVTSAVPLIHAVSGGFLHEYLDAAYFANFRYVGKVSIYEMKGVAFLFLGAVAVALYALVIIHRKSIEKDRIIFIVVTSLVILVIQLIIANYPHYFIVTFGYFSTIYALLIGKFFSKEERVKNRKFVTIGWIVAAMACMSTNLCISLPRYQEEKRINDFVSSVLKEEDKDGHVLVIDASPAYYLQLNIKVGYPDFSLQKNHIPISSHFNYDAFKDYLSSESCHYVLTENSDDLFLETLKDINAVYVKVDNSAYGDLPISLYRHVI